jgi:LemA protein
MNTLQILERVYRLPARKLRPRPLRWAWRRLTHAVQRNVTGLTVGSLGVSLWVVSHIYYYNLLLDLESKVETARAQINVAEQRRNHIQRNLTQLLRYHARYERDVLKEVTNLRNTEKPAPGASPVEALARLNAVGEQYPSLQLNNTVQHFSESTVSSETLVATRIADYNDAVNVYTNALGQFPGNIFGPLMGFHAAYYYTPDDPTVLPYHEVKP